MMDASAVRPGTFAGKWAFASGPPPGPICFLSARSVKGGKDKEKLLMAVMEEAAAIGRTQRLIIYQVAGGLYLQLGDLTWLRKKIDSPLIYRSRDFEEASLFEVNLSPGGQTRLKVRTSQGMQTLYYSVDQATPYLSVNDAVGTSPEFFLTRITASLSEIKADTKCPGGDFADVNLAGENLDDLDLTGAMFYSADLSKASFAGSILEDCKMNAANLSGIRCDGACLDRADLTACNLTGTDWGRPRSAIKINLSGCQAERAILGHSDSPSLDCTGAILSGGMFQQAVLNKAILDGANAQDTVFTRASLRGASLKGIKVQNTNFTQANLDDADLSYGSFNVNGVPQAVFTGASCKKTIALETDLRGVNLQGVNGEKANLKRAKLKDATLSNGLFAFADFKEAEISGANFSRSVLTGADFSGKTDGSSIIQSCSFQGALLQGVRFEQVTLAGAFLTGSEISETEGVPLFNLPPEAEKDLTPENLSLLKPKFSQAGNPLAGDAAIKNEGSWEIDNKNGAPNAPRSYLVNTNDDGNLDVSDAKTKQYLFTMDGEEGRPLLDKGRASPELQQIFKHHQCPSGGRCSLADDATIAGSSYWQIESTPPENFRGAFYYPVMRVYRKTDSLPVYGATQVLLQDWKAAFPEGILFDATVITPEQLSGDSIGPCGEPRSLVGKGMTWQQYLTSIDRKPKQPPGEKPAPPA